MSLVAILDFLHLYLKNPVSICLNALLNTIFSISSTRLTFLVFEDFNFFLQKNNIVITVPFYIPSLAPLESALLIVISPPASSWLAYSYGCRDGKAYYFLFSFKRFFSSYLSSSQGWLSPGSSASQHVHTHQSWCLTEKHLLLLHLHLKEANIVWALFDSFLKSLLDKFL